MELIDPETLTTAGRIHIELPSKSVGLNGIAASADGSKLYIEGPIPLEPMGCCFLYAVDLATLRTSVAASVPGSGSRVSVTNYPHPKISRRVIEPQRDGASSCAEAYVEASVVVGIVVFRYEEFGFKLDRRSRCPGSVPGGAWMADLSSGGRLGQVDPELHFSELIPNQAGSEVCGLATEDPAWKGPVQLVRINPGDGRVKLSRVLDADYWRIATGPLRVVPAGDVRAALS